MKLTIITILALLTAAPAIAAWKLDMMLLRDAVCLIETRGETNPDYGVSRKGDAWGVCQIKYWTAIQYGYPKDESPEHLFNGVVNRHFALIILEGKARTLGQYTIRELIAKYGGHHLNGKPIPYIEDVVRAYQSLRMQRWKRGPTT